MSRLVDLKRAIALQLEALPDVTEVQAFGKLFDQEDISQVSFKSPCVFVAVLAAPGSEALPAGDSRTNVDVVAAIAAKGKPGLAPDEQTLVVAEAVFKAARWAQWGLSGLWPARDRRMEFLPVPGRRGVALLAVRWSHFIRIDDADPDPDMIDADMPEAIAARLRGAEERPA